MYNENKKGIADDISSRLPPIVIVGRSIFFLSSSSVFFFSFLFSSFLCTMKRTRLSTRCVFFLSFFLPSLFVSLLSWFEFCLCHVPFFSFFFSLLFSFLFFFSPRFVEGRRGANYSIIVIVL